MKRALEAVLASSWAIMPEWLETISSIADREHEYAGNLDALEKKLGRPLGNTMSVTVRDGVATIPFEGPMFRRANMMTAYSGASAYSDLAKEFTAAIEDPSVRAIIGYFDTPGGEVNGASELAAMIKEARGKKPMVAYVGGMMCSAGAWIGSAFDSIVAADTSMIGSIGTQMGMTVREPRAGEKSYRFVSSQSPFKNADPSTEAGAQQAQRTVDQLSAVFIKALADNRGTTEANVLEKYGQGSVFVASDALDRGMIDSIGTYESLLTSLSNQRNSQMDYSKLTGAVLAENRPDLVAEIRAEAAASVPNADALRAEGAANERARIAAVREQSLPGHEALIEQLAADGKTTGPEAAVAVLAAERTRTAGAAAARAADAIPPVASAPASEGDDSVPGYAADGSSLDKAKLDAAAKKYMAENPGTDYIAAVKAVQKGE